MAIPDNLYRVDVSGFWADPDVVPAEPLFRWAAIRYILNENVTTDAADLIAMGQIWELTIGSPGGGFGQMARGTFADRRGAVKVDDSTTAHNEDEEHIGNGFAGNCVPAQVAFFVLGRTASLRHQTRIWVPCFMRETLDEPIPQWKPTNRDGAPLNTYAASLLAPRAGPDGLMTPVVWDPITEVARAIIDTVYSKWPRTQRRRALSTETEWIGT